MCIHQFSQVGYIIWPQVYSISRRFNEKVKCSAGVCVLLSPRVSVWWDILFHFEEVLEIKRFSLLNKIPRGYLGAGVEVYVFKCSFNGFNFV